MSTATAETPIAADPMALATAMVKKVATIATLPEITARIITVVEDPKSTPAHLHKIISNDPALVARILKVVNSAFYGLPGQIASVERAIVLLGLNAVKNLSIAASLGQLFRGAKLCEGFSAKDLWTHCVGVGVLARELARQIKFPLADEAFLAGLIHDIGLLVSLQVTPEKLRDVCERAKTSETPFCEIEREITGVDHQLLGTALCVSWKFPRTCQLVAGYHHRPTELGDANRVLVTLVAVADTLCAAAGQGFNLTAVHQTLESLEYPAVGLDSAVVEAVRGKLGELMSGSATLFA